MNNRKGRSKTCDCAHTRGGGSPRFSINYGTRNVFVYLGSCPSFTDANRAAAGQN